MRVLEQIFGELGAGAVLCILCLSGVLSSLHWLTSKLEFQRIPAAKSRGFFAWGRDVSRRAFFVHFWIGYLLVVAAIALLAAERNE